MKYAARRPHLRKSIHWMSQRQRQQTSTEHCFAEVKGNLTQQLPTSTTITYDFCLTGLVICS